MYRKWKGTYEYEKNKHQEATGFDRTNFEVEITSISGSNFIGKIVDDVNMGGTAVSEKLRSEFQEMRLSL